MTQIDKIDRLSALLAEAQRTGIPVSVPSDLVPANEDEADRVQDALSGPFGDVAAYKVAQTGDAAGSYGVIFAADLYEGDQVIRSSRRDLKVEVEIAFRLGADLPGAAAPYQRADIEAAIAGAVVAVEIVGGRLPGSPKPSPLLTRADRLSNFGLATGAVVADWRPFARPADYDASLRIDGVTIVSGGRPHPSGVDPLHPVVWLANRLARRGVGLRAGDVVTTGAFGGSHPVRLGQSIEASVRGLGSLVFAIEAEKATAAG